MIYFTHFQVSPLPSVMSDILFHARIPLSQLSPCFFSYLQRFVNVCLALNTSSKMELFLQFMIFKYTSDGVDRVVCMHRVSSSHSDAICVNFPPSNYENRVWQKRFFFIKAEFVLGSRRKRIKIRRGYNLLAPHLSERNKGMM